MKEWSRRLREWGSRTTPSSVMEWRREGTSEKKPAPVRERRTRE